MKKRALILGVIIASGLSCSVLANDAPVEDINQMNANGGHSMPAPKNTSSESAATASDSAEAVNQAPAVVPQGQQPQVANVDTTVPQTQPVSATSNNTSNATASGDSNPNISNKVPAYGATPSTTVTLPSASVQNLTMDQRVARLEQQIANLTRMNLPQQISDMQQQLQQLSGELQVQSHDIKLLNDQQRSFYQDLDQRIKQLSNLSGNGSGNNNSDGASSTQSSKSNMATTDIALQDSNAYKAAFDYLAKKDVDKAEQGFQDYLNNYPNGAYQANAHYWLGEIYLVKKQKQTAMNEFSNVVKNFAKSSKVPDAKLKIAMINASQGKKGLAQTQFKQIKKQYPHSTAAQLASIQLQQLQ